MVAYSLPVLFSARQHVYLELYCELLVESFQCCTPLFTAEPDWFAAYDEQKAQKDAAHRLKASTSTISACTALPSCVYTSVVFLS